jgi:hypothetical protein
MGFSLIPTEEFPENELIGDFKLFDHCASDETQKHKYQFKIAEDRKTIIEMCDDFLKNPKNPESLVCYNISVATDFCFFAFIHNYSFDCRKDFLDYQLSRTVAVEIFLNRVRNLLMAYDWNSYNDGFGDKDLKKQQVIEWLNLKFKLLKSNKLKSKLSHRHHALIYYYKCEAGYLPKEFPRKIIAAQFGKARERAIDTIWNKNSTSYKAPDIYELEVILPYLTVTSRAYKAVVNDINQLK